ncbi:MAG TPA: hypothetical protein PKC30_16220 [Saprospiraceae bacterium]|nr:hypothetical protein [Saprospiraceae bacterium]
MSTNKILISGVVAGVVTFLLGWLLYGMLLASFFEGQTGSAQGVMRADDDMVWWALVLGNLLYGVLLAYVFGKWANISTPSTGATAGATLGFLLAASWGLVYFATANIMTLTGTIADIVVWTVISAIAGAAAAWMLGRG